MSRSHMPVTVKTKGPASAAGVSASSERIQSADKGKAVRDQPGGLSLCRRLNAQVKAVIEASP